MSALAVTTPDLFSDARLQLIRDTVARGAPPEVFSAMIEIARVRGLDPLAKQISVIQLGGTWQVLTTIDGYRALAEASENYAGQDAPVHEFNGDKLISTSVTVYKIVQGIRCSFTAKVYASEYNTGKSSWARMPITMLTKVAESHALRKAFPSVLGGLYTREEMDQATDPPPRHVDVSTGEIVDVPPHANFDAQELRDGLVAESKAKQEARATTTVEVEDRPRNYSPLYAAGKDAGLKPDDVKAMAYARYNIESVKDMTTEQLIELTAYFKTTDPEDVQSDFAELAG